MTNRRKSHNPKGFDDDSMTEELKNFQNEDIINYKFEIPLKYQIGKNVKVVNESVRKDGKLLKYYENSVLEIISKNNTLSRVFPDGYSITYYANKDIKQVKLIFKFKTYADGRIIYFYSKNKSLEFNFPSQGFIAYKFKNNQLEKHYFDGRKYIK